MRVRKLKERFNRFNLLHHINRTIVESEDLDSLVNVVLGKSSMTSRSCAI